MTYTCEIRYNNDCIEYIKYDEYISKIDYYVFFLYTEMVKIINMKYVKSITKVKDNE